MSAVCQSCQTLGNPECQKQQQSEDCFTRIAGIAINKNDAGNSPLGRKLEQHKKDLKAARRAKAAAAVYDINTKGELAKPPPCIKLIDTNSEASLRLLERDLGLKANSLHPDDFANEKNGYRAAVFYDQRDEKYVVTFRGTNKNNLIDWENNINNQLPNATASDAPSYFAAKELGGLLKNSKPPVEYAGHSKGGGEVYEALSNSPNSIATVFNPAGPSPRISEVTRMDISGRTQNYQVGGEMLNLMQNETDPEKTIQNMKWLRKQVNDGCWGTAIAVKITERDNVTIGDKKALRNKIATAISTNTYTDETMAAQSKLNKIEQDYNTERQDFIAGLDKQIAAKEAWLKDKKAGKAVPAWTSPFAKSLGEERVLGGKPGRKSEDIGISALSDHTMDTMNSVLKKQIETDHKEIEKAVRQSDPNFDKKLKDCSATS